MHGPGAAAAGPSSFEAAYGGRLRMTD